MVSSLREFSRESGVDVAAVFKKFGALPVNPHTMAGA
jgi:hypothetical protein